jgi:hypothetical protein
VTVDKVGNNIKFLNTQLLMLLLDTNTALTAPSKGVKVLHYTGIPLPKNTAAIPDLRHATFAITVPYYDAKYIRMQYKTLTAVQILNSVY